MSTLEGWRVFWLAAAAVSATLERASQLNLGKAVEAIGRTVLADLGGELNRTSQLRGRGALWAVELPSDSAAVSRLTLRLTDSR